MNELTSKLRVNLIEQWIIRYSEHFHYMTEVESKKFLDCMNSIINSNDRIVIEANISNMYLMTKKFKDNPEVKLYNMKLARKMVKQKYSNEDIQELLGLSYYEIECIRRENATTD